MIQHAAQPKVIRRLSTSSTVVSSEGCLNAERQHSHQQHRQQSGEQEAWYQQHHERQEEEDLDYNELDEGSVVSLGSSYREFYKDLPAQVPFVVTSSHRLARLDNTSVSEEDAVGSISSSPWPSPTKTISTSHSPYCTHLVSGKLPEDRDTPVTDFTSLSSTMNVSSTPDNSFAESKPFSSCSMECARSEVLPPLLSMFQPVNPSNSSLMDDDHLLNNEANNASMEHEASDAISSRLRHAVEEKRQKLEQQLHDSAMHNYPYIPSLSTGRDMGGKAQTARTLETPSTMVETKSRRSRMNKCTTPLSSERYHVAVRIRPLQSEEDEDSVKPSKRARRWSLHSHKRRKASLDYQRAWSIEADSETSKPMLLQTDASRHTAGRNLFTFDSVFDSEKSTAALYQSVAKPVVDVALQRQQHGTIFAYGATATGKTYTMQGDHGRYGIVQLAVMDILQRMEAKDFDLRAQYFEVYNEKVRDLLYQPPSEVDTDESRSGEVTLTTVPHGPEPVVVVHAKMHCIQTVSDVVEVLTRGNRRRKFAITERNGSSSRSHAILRLTLDQGGKTSVLNLVDMAASDIGMFGGIAGMRKKEAARMNQSLVSFSRVIHALSLPPHKRPKHMGYRDSKLTQIMEPHLSSNVALLCCISAARVHSEETRATLKFANRAQRIEVQVPLAQAHLVDQTALLSAVQRELEVTREKLRSLRQRSSTEKVKIESPVCIPSPSIENKNSMESYLFDASEVMAKAASAPTSPVASSPPLKSPALKVECSDEQVCYSPVPANSPVSAISEHEESDVSSVMAIGDDEMEDSLPLVPLSHHQQHSSHIVSGRLDASVSSTSDDGPPLGEVVVLMEKMSFTSTKNTADRLNEAEDRVTFLSEKLEATDDLVEALFKELQHVQEHNTEMQMRNTELNVAVDKLRDTDSSVTQDFEVLMRQCVLLKYAIAIGLGFFVTGNSENYMATILFIWLSLVVVTTKAKD